MPEYFFNRRIDIVVVETPRQYWLLILFRGIIALLFGIMALISVEFTLLFLVYLFGAYVLIDGILSIIVGIVFFLHPSSSILSIVWLLGLFAMVYGIIQIIKAFQVKSLLGV